jgi:hypothetical protein
MGDPSKLPTMCDATIQTALEAFAQLASDYGPPPHLGLRWPPEVMGEVVRWAQGAYDVLTAFLSEMMTENPDTTVEKWLPYLRALVRRQEDTP